VAYGVGLVVSVVGVAVTYNHPTGPAIVALFGLALVATLAWYAVTHAERPGVALGQGVAAMAGVAGVLWVFGQVPPEEAHDHGTEEFEPPPVAAGGSLGAADASARDAAARTETDASALAAALSTEADESVRLTMAVALCRAGDRRGIEALVGLTVSETPFVRMEADTRLRVLAGAASPAWDPLTGLDAAGAWAAWLAGTEGVPQSAATLAMP
jgi:hypothetical protein